MGHGLLIRTLALAALAALLPGSPAPAQEAGDATREAHADLSCAACHRGPSADREVGAVPAATCTASGCHEAGGPQEASFPTVTFAHRGHADTAAVEMACAGCHRHEEGETSLRAGGDACSLCHADQVTGARPDACRACHGQPMHVPVTNQGVPVPHRDLPWIETGCVRCHYDVGHPTLTVRSARCAACHDEGGRVVEEGIGRDLHPEHTGVACVSCHEGGGHDIEAMSSSVQLACGSCHPSAHGTEGLAARSAGDGPAPVGPGLCTDCHRSTHADAQRLVLGIVPGMEVAPAYKFREGLTCGSCHGAGTDEPGSSASAAGACADCHLRDYGRIGGWWERGARLRDRRVAAYLERSRGSLAGSADTAVALLGSAGELLRIARDGGVWHNPVLVDRMQREALGRAAEAWRAAGRTPPARPDLGNQVRVGYCAYCHYVPGEPTLDDVPTTGFHARQPRSGR